MSKRMRRVIANSNERKRMQNINAGFETLRYLMPHLQGEKLSKVSLQFPRMKMGSILRLKIGGPIKASSCFVVNPIFCLVGIRVATCS